MFYWLIWGFANPQPYFYPGSEILVFFSKISRMKMLNFKLISGIGLIFKNNPRILKTPMKNSTV